MTDVELKSMYAKHPKLKQLTLRGRFRYKIASIIRDMEGMGYKPWLFEGKRTLARQKKLVAQGRSRTMNSYHLPGRDGLSRAADIVQNDKDPWSTTEEDRKFWLTLGRLATINGLLWGGTWLDTKTSSRRAKLIAFITDRTKPWKPQNYKGATGWDMPHCQTVGVPK